MKWGRPFFTFRNALQIQLHCFVVFGGLWETFGLPLGLFLPWELFGLPLEAFGPQIGRQNLLKLQKGTPTPTETKNCQEFAEIPPRTAENPPRTAENPPRTRPEPAVRTSSKKHIPRYGFYDSTSFSDRRSNKTPRTKVGRRCSPLGGLQLNNSERPNSWPRASTN